MRLKMTLVGLGLATMLGAGTASAFETLNPQILDPAKAAYCQKNPAKCSNKVHAVPEIDVTAGSKAIALVLGLLLLGAESLRRRPGRLDQ